MTDLPKLPPRSADSNKGTFGRVLIVAGSRGMSGAGVLCARAALRGGAGLVRLATPAEVLPIVAAANPNYLTAGLPQNDNGQLGAAARTAVVKLARANDVTAVGPGLGSGPGVRLVVEVLLRESQRPLVIDADGLNVLRQRTEQLKGRAAGTILTPHPGEFARLLDCDVPTVRARRRELAVRFAREHGVVLLLKGHGTIVTDGQRVYCNTTGNPGMATGGTGDVLTGLIAGLVGQGLEAFAAAQLGSYLHGRAGDLAARDLGEVSLVASDLLDYLPRALREG